jgi:hypothetical protein
MPVPPTRESRRAPPSSAEQEGETCPSAGLECQPTNGTPLRCAAADPKLQTGGCPISSRRFKQDIRYLSDQDLERIEDDPTSPAVAEGRTQIDLYGYTSMVVAAMKIQARRLEEQNAELGLLRRKIEAGVRKTALALAQPSPSRAPSRKTSHSGEARDIQCRPKGRGRLD